MKLLKDTKQHYLKTATKGLFFLIPIVAIIAIIVWLYKKVDIITGEMFKLIGLVPEHNMFLWTAFGLIILGAIVYVVGILEEKLEEYFKDLLHKVPGYSTIKDLVNIFNSSKKGEQNVLVVMVKGFSKKGYNIGLMYSTKESVIKNHYTVVLSQTPIPNGGYMFEEHKNDILVLTEAKFDDNLQYLLSMGTKSLPEIMGTKSSELSELKTLNEYLNEKEIK